METDPSGQIAASRGALPLEHYGTVAGEAKSVDVPVVSGHNSHLETGGVDSEWNSSSCSVRTASERLLFDELVQML
jgi:hypothetical protein